MSAVVETIKKVKTNCQNILTFEKRLELKTNGRPLPELQIRQTSKDKNKDVHRNFRRGMYDFSDWICGCEVTNAFYCFVCLIFSNAQDSMWCKNGVTDLKHLKDKIRKHSLSAEHMKCSINYAIIGRVDIRSQLDNAYRKSLTDFNQKVTENRYFLNKIIDCVKFCGAFELALRGYDDAIPSETENPGVFRGLVDFVSELDLIFKDYLEKNTDFKGTSKTVQNDLLDSMLVVAQEKIKLEIQSADFVAVQVIETADSSNKTRMVFIIRYIFNGNVHERFLKFTDPSGTTSEILTNVILKELEILEINKTPEKLIAQSYDGASAMSGRLGGVQTKIKEHYPEAHFIHCYAHQLNLIVQKAASQDKNVKIFFANLQAFSTFFSRSPKRIAVLDEFVQIRLPRSAPTTWYFNTHCVVTVFLYQTDILACLEKIIDTEEDADSLNQAIGLKNFLQDQDFLYWLHFFHLIMPNCDILFNQLQNRGIDAIFLKNYICSFKKSIEDVRNKIASEAPSETPVSSTTGPGDAKRCRRNEDSKRRVSLQVCDIIISEISHRFSFSDHLIIAQLFYGDQFKEYTTKFPESILKLVKKDFPCINNVKLKTELEVIYEREDFHESSGALAILQLFIKNNLCETFSESVKLLKILCTLPMTTVEPERCFSTLKRIKTFLRNTKGQERLSALAMLSIEKSFIKNIINYNELVIEHFSNSKETTDNRIELKFERV